MRIDSYFPKRRARIEIIPLIDIVFFLLATFVMVSLSMVRNQGIGVNLPTSTTSVAQDHKASFVVTVTEEGALFLEKESVSLEELSSKLASLKTSDSDIKIFINGDDRAYFGAAIKVLDAIRTTGITKIAIQTKPLSREIEDLSKK